MCVCVCVCVYIDVAIYNGDSSICKITTKWSCRHKSETEVKTEEIVLDERFSGFVNDAILLVT